MCARAGLLFGVATTAGVLLGYVLSGEIDLYVADALERRLREIAREHGEILDVDGRLGGFNFQWAWSSGFVAGTSAARRLA